MAAVLSLVWASVCTVSDILERFSCLQIAVRSYPHVKTWLEEVMKLYERHENVLQEMQKSLEGERKDWRSIENDSVLNFLHSVTHHLGKAKNEICGMKEYETIECASGSNVSDVG